MHHEENVIWNKCNMKKMQPKKVEHKEERNVEKCNMKKMQHEKSNDGNIRKNSALQNTNG